MAIVRAWKAASSTSAYTYDVFFMSISDKYVYKLYPSPLHSFGEAGFRTYRDIGDIEIDIKPELEKAIKESKISNIIV